MTRFTLVQLTDGLTARLNDEDLACELVGLALADLGLPVQADYSDLECMTIWSKLAEVQARLLVRTDAVEAQALGEAMLPWIGVLQDQVRILADERARPTPSGAV